MPEPILMFRSPRRPPAHQPQAHQPQVSRPQVSQPQVSRPQALGPRDMDWTVREDDDDPIPDHTTLAGAQALARRIRAYWRQRGHEIEIRLVTTSNGRDTVAHIRSDMVGGLPRRRG